MSEFPMVVIRFIYFYLFLLRSSAGRYELRGPAPPTPRRHEWGSFPAAAAALPAGGELATCLNVRIASPMYLMDK